MFDYRWEGYSEDGDWVRKRGYRKRCFLEKIRKDLFVNLIVFIMSYYM